MPRNNPFGLPDELSRDDFAEADEMLSNGVRSLFVTTFGDNGQPVAKVIYPPSAWTHELLHAHYRIAVQWQGDFEIENVPTNTHAVWLNGCVTHVAESTFDAKSVQYVPYDWRQLQGKFISRVIVK